MFDSLPVFSLLLEFIPFLRILVKVKVGSCSAPKYYFRFCPRKSVKMLRVYRVLFRECGKKRLLSAEDNFKNFIKFDRLTFLT